jgi:hypothetical protein
MSAPTIAGNTRATMHHQRDETANTTVTMLMARTPAASPIQDSTSVTFPTPDPNLPTSSLTKSLTQSPSSLHSKLCSTTIVK